MRAASFARMMKYLILPIVLAALLVATQSFAADTTGAGSTFVSPVMAKWIDAYKAKTGNTVTYQAVGSSIGIGSIKKATVDFGATDMPLDPKELEKLGMIQFPIVIGGVVPVVNIDGVKPGQMHFSGEALAGIYLGKIKSWNDPAIRAINPDMRLPNAPITVVHRIDGSGTMFNWSNYLSKVSPQWKAAVGEGTAVEWPVGVGGRGNDGVASLVGLVPGAIGYLEYAYALNGSTRSRSAWCRIAPAISSSPTPRRSRRQLRTRTGRRTGISISSSPTRRARMPIRSPPRRSW